MSSPADDVDREELRRYVRRVSDRWPVQDAFVGGPRVTGIRTDGPEFLVVLVSQGFDGVPWLERVYQSESLWDSAHMGGQAEVHCYTPVEFERKLARLPAVQEAAEHGIGVEP